MNQMSKAVEITAPTVAVIIPFYDGAVWVERAIKSVMAQTVPPDEFIIVNDGSKSEERAALGKLSETYPFRIIDKPNGGQGSARNAGVHASTSEYISFLDQDDYYFPDHIRDLVEAIPEKDSRLGYLYADLCAADGAGNILHANMLRDTQSRHPKQGHIRGLLRFDLFILPSASLIKKSAFLAVGGFDEQFTGYEDDDLFLRMFRAGYTNHFVDTPVTAWCQHSGSTSWTIKMSRSRWKYLNKLRAAFPDDTHTGVLYFRDYLMPRFAPMFIVETMEATRSNSKDREEVVGILREFSKIVSANPYVGRRYKFKLGLFTWAMSNCPRPVLFTFQRMARFPILRRFAGRLLRP
jgi:glycosyltransferase involved in cell wall biosynthesis